MDISHFGLFDLAGRSPRWSDRGPGITELPSLTACNAPVCIANDNRIAGRAPRPSLSLLRLLAGRSRQPRPA